MLTTKTIHILKVNIRKRYEILFKKRKRWDFPLEIVIITLKKIYYSFS